MTANGTIRRFPEAKLFDRLPPHSVDAEMSLLGSLIIDPKQCDEVATILAGPEDFYSVAHATIYEAICRLYDGRQSLDLVQLLESLDGREQLADVGGRAYLLRLGEGVPSAVNAPHYARSVAARAKLRRMIDACSAGVHEAYHVADFEDAQGILDRTEAAVMQAADHGRQDAGAIPLGVLLDAEFKRLESPTGEAGIPTGYPDLDRMLCGGLRPGEFIIVAARPSMGKSALSTDFARLIAKRKVPVGLFTLEMDKSSVTCRMLAAESGLCLNDLRSGDKLGDAQFKRAMQACNGLLEAPLYVDDRSGHTILSIRAAARRMVSQHKVRVLVIDYLQLLTAPQQARESRQVEVSAISRGVKDLARSLNVPVIALAQLNRGAEQRENNRPRLSDLRESGSLEQDADIVMLLHREEYYHIGDTQWAQGNPDKIGLAELIIAKQRNGATGPVELVWDAKSTTFKSKAASWQENQWAGSVAP